MLPLVLKIGGSLAGSDRARYVLDQVKRSARDIVVVPGGGVYADAVRTDQVREGFDDAEAHRRAIIAMHRIASEFQVLQPQLIPAGSEDAVRDAWRHARAAVWLPWPMVEQEPSIPQDWTVTSDALAAWLAAKLAGEVALIKSCAIPAHASLQDLAAAGITDPQFPKLVAQSALVWHVLGEGDEGRLTQLLGP